MAKVNQLKEIWESFAFTRLVRTFRLAVGPSKMLIALLAVITVCSFGWTMDIITTGNIAQFTNPEDLKSEIQFIEYSIPSGWWKNNGAGDKSSKRKKIISDLEEFSKSRGVFSTLWNFTSKRFNTAVTSLLQLKFSDTIRNVGVCSLALLWAIKYHPVYSVIFLTFTITVVSLCGGAICRCAALEFARREKPGLTESLKFAFEKLAGFIAAPMIPIGIMIAAGTLLVIIGGFGNIPVIGKIIMALSIGFALLLGLFIALFLVGTVIGYHLMFPVIAYEGSNGFDAISRSFAYVYAHPWCTVFYGLIASFYGVICYLFMRFFVFLLLIITYHLMSIGVFDIENQIDVLSRIWAKPELFNLLRENTEITMTSSEAAASFIIQMAVLFVIAMLAAFVVSFYYSGCTIIYALMREKVDKVPTGQVYIHLDRVKDN